MTDTLCESEGQHHYAACNDCPLYSWAESNEEAEDRVRNHEEKFDGHEAYVGTAVVEG